MQSHYEINVAESTGKKSPPYQHLFRTGESLVQLGEAKRVFDLLKAAFPAPQYNVTMTHWEVLGKSIA